MLTPKPMRHLRLLVLREHLPQVSLTLAETEHFHPDARNPEEESLQPLADCRYQSEYQQARARLEKLRHIIPIPPADLGTIRVVGLEELIATNTFLGEAWATCLKHQEQFRTLEEQERLLDEQEAAIANFTELQVDLATLRADKHFLELHIGIVPRETLKRLEGALGLAGYLLLEYREQDDNIHVVIIGPKGDKEGELNSLLTSAGFTPIPLPKGLDDSPEAIQTEQRLQRERIASQRRELQEETSACAASMHKELRQAETVLTLAEPFVTLDPAIRSAGQLSSINGWVPAEHLADLEQRLAQALTHPYSLESRKPRPDERSLVPSVPVRHRLLQPFGLLVKQYGVPRYGEIDPTFLFTISFLLMFGTMFGDIGHGAVLAILAWALRKKLGTIYLFGVMAGISSIAFGFIFGSFFGYKDIIPALWMSPLYDPILMLQIAAGWGVFFLTVACLLTIYNRVAVGDRIAAVFGHHGLINLVFYLALIWGGVLLATSGNFGSVPAALTLGALGLLAVYNWFHLQAPIGEKVLMVVIETLETVIGYVSNTLSFLRVAAFSINHVALAMAVLTLAGMMGAVGHVLMVIFGNIFIIVLEGVIVTIQIMRLQFFEGFSRYFYADGKEFSPVRLRKQAGTT